jgi:hypothetical protein
MDHAHERTECLRWAYLDLRDCALVLVEKIQALLERMTNGKRFMLTLANRVEA